MALAQEAGGFWEQPHQLPWGRAQVHPATAVFMPTAVGGSWLLQAAQQQDGPRCSKDKRTQGKDLHLSHLCCVPGLSPCCVLPAWECWQHVLAARRGCVVVLFDFKVPLPCLAREVVPKRRIVNVREELSLHGLNCKPCCCGIKRKKESGKKETQVFLSVWCSAWQLVRVTRARAGTRAPGGREQRAEEPVRDPLTRVLWSSASCRELPSRRHFLPPPGAPEEKGFAQEVGAAALFIEELFVWT